MLGSLLSAFFPKGGNAPGPAQVLPAPAEHDHGGSNSILDKSAFYAEEDELWVQQVAQSTQQQQQQTAKLKPQNELDDALREAMQVASAVTAFIALQPGVSDSSALQCYGVRYDLEEGESKGVRGGVGLGAALRRAVQHCCTIDAAAVDGIAPSTAPTTTTTSSSSSKVALSSSQLLSLIHTAAHVASLFPRPNTDANQAATKEATSSSPVALPTDRTRSLSNWSYLSLLDLALALLLAHIHPNPNPDATFDLAPAAAATDAVLSALLQLGLGVGLAAGEDSEGGPEREMGLRLGSGLAVQYMCAVQRALLLVGGMQRLGSRAGSGLGSLLSSVSDCLRAMPVPTPTPTPGPVFCTYMHTCLIAWRLHRRLALAAPRLLNGAPTPTLCMGPTEALSALRLGLGIGRIGNKRVTPNPARCGFALAGMRYGLESGAELEWLECVTECLSLILPFILTVTLSAVAALEAGPENSTDYPNPDPNLAVMSIAPALLESAMILRQRLGLWMCAEGGSAEERGRGRGRDRAAMDALVLQQVRGRGKDRGRVRAAMDALVLLLGAYLCGASDTVKKMRAANVGHLGLRGRAEGGAGQGLAAGSRAGEVGAESRADGLTPLVLTDRAEDGDASRCRVLSLSTQSPNPNPSKLHPNLSTSPIVSGSQVSLGPGILLIPSNGDMYTPSNGTQTPSRDTYTPLRAEAVAFKVGDRVDGLCLLPNGTKRWFPGFIAAVGDAEMAAAASASLTPTRTPTYTVVYNDGDTHTEKAQSELRRTKSRANMNLSGSGSGSGSGLGSAFGTGSGLASATVISVPTPAMGSNPTPKPTPAVSSGMALEIEAGNPLAPNPSPSPTLRNPNPNPNPIPNPNPSPSHPDPDDDSDNDDNIVFEIPSTINTQNGHRIRQNSMKKSLHLSLADLNAGSGSSLSRSIPHSGSLSSMQMDPCPPDVRGSSSVVLTASGTYVLVPEFAEERLSLHSASTLSRPPSSLNTHRHDSSEKNAITHRDTYTQRSAITARGATPSGDRLTHRPPSTSNSYRPHSGMSDRILYSGYGKRDPGPSPNLTQRDSVAEALGAGQDDSGTVLTAYSQTTHGTNRCPNPHLLSHDGSESTFVPTYQSFQPTPGPITAPNSNPNPNPDPRWEVPHESSEQPNFISPTLTLTLTLLLKVSTMAAALCIDACCQEDSPAGPDSEISSAPGGAALRNALLEAPLPLAPTLFHAPNSSKTLLSALTEWLTDAQHLHAHVLSPLAPEPQPNPLSTLYLLCSFTGRRLVTLLGLPPMPSVPDLQACLGKS